MFIICLHIIDSITSRNLVQCHKNLFVVQMILSANMEQCPAFKEVTSCRWSAATICLAPSMLTIIFVFIRQLHLFRHVGYLRHKQVDL